MLDEKPIQAKAKGKPRRKNAAGQDIVEDDEEAEGWGGFEGWEEEYDGAGQKAVILGEEKEMKGKEHVFSI